MKKSVFFAAAAAIMVSSTMTLTAHAAVKAVVIGSNGTVLTGKRFPAGAAEWTEL